MKKMIGDSIVLALAAALLVPVPWAAAQSDPFGAAAVSPDGGARVGVIASVEFVDTPITTVFKMISDLTGWSIVMSPEVSGKPPRVNLWIKNMAPEQVLERVVGVAGLVAKREGRVVQVFTFDEYAKVAGLEKKVITLQNARAKDLAGLLQPFVVKDQARVLANEESNKLVLLVPDPLLGSLTKLIESLDVPFEKDTVRLVALQHLEASQVVPKLEKFLAESAKESLRSTVVRGEGATGQPAEVIETARAGEKWLVKFMIEPRLNVIVLRGLASDVEQAQQLLAKLDTPADIRVVPYPLRYTNAAEMYRTLDELLREERRGQGGAGVQETPRWRVSVSEQNNSIIVEGSGKDQQRLARLIDAIDRPLPPGSGGVRVYRLENSSAKEVAQVIQDVINNRQGSALLAQRGKAEGSDVAGPPQPKSAGPTAFPTAPLASPAVSSVSVAPMAAGTTPVAGKPEGPSGDVIPLQVTAAPEINAVIIRGSAAEQEEMAALVRELDKPRDQVQLEVTLVNVRSTDSFSFSVEGSIANINLGGTSGIGFTSFGVGTVDTATGNLAFASPPPTGLNLGVFRSEDYSFVMNMLKTVGETRITSSPRIIVEDNAQAQIRQIAKEPYATVSQGQASTITSFGGYAEAGTTLTVIPHIAKDDWMRLEYAIDLSSFDQRNVEQIRANLPPPARQNTSQGTVRLPADHTVVLGGLVGTRDDRTRDGVPLLMDIPVVGALFGRQFTSKVNETLFIFIRPVVLRDPAFRDLRFLSEREMEQAQFQQRDLPTNPIKTFSLDQSADKGGTCQ